MKKIIHAALLVAAVLLAGTTAQAATTTTAPVNELARAEGMLPGGENAGDLMTPVAGDISMKVIRQVLGGDMSTASNTLPIIGDAMLVFNIIMLAIGSFIFTGVAVSGVLRTGADGEALGKKWSNMWVPLRFGASTALLIPTGSGFSVGQVMTMAAIAMGVGAGDSVWRAASTNAVTRMGELSAFTVQASKEDVDMAKMLLKNELCLANYQRYSDAMAAKNRVANPIETVRQTNLQTGTIYWSIVEKPFSATAVPPMLPKGDPLRATLMPMGGNTKQYQGICGRSEVFYKPVPATTAAGAIVSGAVTRVANATPVTLTSSQQINEMIDNTSRTIDDAKRVGVLAAADQLKRYAEQVAATYTVYEIPLNGDEPAGTLPQLDFTSKNATITENGTKEAIEQAVQLYKQQLATAIVNRPDTSQFSKKMIEDANSSGWANSGIWFYQFAKISSGIKSKLNSPSVVYGPMPTNMSGGNPPSESTSTADASVDEVGEPGWASALTLSPAEAVDFAAGKFYSSLGANDPGFMQRWFGYNPNSDDHPLIQLQQSGLMMMDLGIAIKTALHVGEFAVDVGTGNIVSTVIDKVTGGAEAVSNLLKQVIGPFHYLALILIVIGAMKAFLIPLLPFIKVLKAVVMFFITVCEVLVATPLWIAFHMTPDGDGFASDKVQGGYGIVLEAALRPVLIVFGLLFAFLLMWPVMTFFASGFSVVTDTIGQGVGVQYDSLSNFADTATSAPTLLSAAAGGAAAAGAIAGTTVAAPALVVGTVAVGAGLFMNKIIALSLYLVFFVMLSYLVVDKCCDVIDVLPANVMRWINIHANGGNSDMEREFNAGGVAVKNDMRGAMSSNPSKSKGLDPENNIPGKPGSKTPGRLAD